MHVTAHYCIQIKHTALIVRLLECWGHGNEKRCTNIEPSTARCIVRDVVELNELMIEVGHEIVESLLKFYSSKPLVVVYYIWAYIS